MYVDRAGARFDSACARCRLCRRVTALRVAFSLTCPLSSTFTGLSTLRPASRRYWQAVRRIGVGVGVCVGVIPTPRRGVVPLTRCRRHGGVVPTWCSRRALVLPNGRVVDSSAGVSTGRRGVSDVVPVGDRHFYQDCPAHQPVFGGMLFRRARGFNATSLYAPRRPRFDLGKKTKITMRVSTLPRCVRPFGMRVDRAGRGMLMPATCSRAAGRGPSRCRSRTRSDGSMYRVGHWVSVVARCG